ncbi:MAG: nucleoside monophosphate kinase [Bacilli bacterium]
MKNIILIAAPAAGKGTQAKLLQQKYAFAHISIGDLIRSSLTDDNDFSKKLKEKMQKGELIDDNLIFKLLTARLALSDCSQGYILDGFPRNVNQAIMYDKMLLDNHKNIGHVILLDVAKDVVKNRVLGRQTCPSCGNIYNKFNENKPKTDNVCDNCHIALTSRDDDNSDTFEKRYQTYLNETMPIINYYQSKGALKIIDGSISQDYTFREIEKIVSEDKDD